MFKAKILAGGILALLLGAGLTRTTYSMIQGAPVNVLDKGADSTGVTSSTAALAAAYTAAAAKGQAIYIPAGTYKVNLTILRGGVRIYGAGRARVADTTPVGGTILIPDDLTKPIIQVGDGTALVEKTTLEHFSMKGDGTFTVAGTSTSDGLKIVGAYNTHVSDFEIGHMGGKCIYVTSGATRSTAYTYFEKGEVINCSRYGVLADYGTSFTAGTFFNQVNFSPANIGSGDVDLRVEGTDVSLSNSWVQVLDAHGHIYLYKDAGGRAPVLRLNNTAVDTGGHPTWTAMDINIGGAHRLLNWYVSGSAYFIDGKIHWDDATVVSGDATNVVAPPYRFGVNAKIQERLYFDIFQDSGGNVFNDADTPVMSLTGQERTTGGAVPLLNFAGGHFRVPGLYNQAFQFGANGAVWRNATTTRLHYRPDFPYPGNDIDGAPFTPLRKAVTYSASMTPVLDQGSWFYIAATNGTAFTINAPTINATTAANFSGARFTFTISNQSGGALGVATWNAIYKMSAWTQPLNTFSRSVDFLYDGTNYIQVAQTGVDVPN